MQNKYFKFLIIVLAVAVIVPQVALASWWNPFSWGIWNSIFHFQKTEQQQTQTSPLEKACVQSGGKVTKVDCYCSGTEDFYNTCLVGACACPPNPQFKKEVKMCDCGNEKCWDGTKCTDLNLSPAQTEGNPEALPISSGQTAGWRTYDNTFNYAFQIKYPADWSLQLSGNGSIKNPPTLINKNKIGTIDIVSASGNCDNLIKLYIDSQKVEGADIVSMKIGDYDGYEITQNWPFLDNLPISIDYTCQNEKLIRFMYFEGKERPNYNEFKQILSTFKFTK